jgi:hypothetical protein
MDLKHVFQRIREFQNMHLIEYDIVYFKHYIQLLKAYKPMALQRYTVYKQLFSIFSVCERAVSFKKNELL